MVLQLFLGDKMNEKTKYYYNDLPDGYIEDYVIDAKDTKFTIIFGLIINVILIVGTIALCLFLKGFSFTAFKEYRQANIHIFLFGMLTLIVSFFIYMILHELTHGLFFKIFTHEKLTFGLTLTVAYCGVPKLYVRKWPMFITTLAPFVTFIFVFGLPVIFIDNIIFYFVFSLLLGFHIGGCVGDLYGATIMLFKYRKNKDLLINDTGPKQTYYIKK